MKLILVSLALVSCVDPSEPIPIESKAAQGLQNQNQPGETIVVTACAPGEVGDGTTCVRPIDNLPPADRGGGWDGSAIDNQRGLSPDEYRGEVDYIQGDVKVLVPGVTLVAYEYSLTSEVCEYLCAAEALAMCVAVESACTLGSTFTLGGVTLPCAAAVVAACAAAEQWKPHCVQVSCK